MKRILFIAVCFAALATVFPGCEKTEDENGANKPAAVENLTATPGNAQVILSWEVPIDDGGSPVTHYELTNDNWTNKVSKTVDELAHTYTGLTNDTKYTFRVRAINAEGAGAESTATATPTAPAGPTGPLGADYTLPTNLKITYKQGGTDHTSIKIGNDYYHNTGITSGEGLRQVYITWDATTRKTKIYTDAGNGWVLALQPTDTEVTLRRDILHYIYTDIVLDRSKASPRPVSGSGMVAGRPVQIRDHHANGLFYYVDIEHTLILKKIAQNTTVLEVTSWDETVTRFDNVSLPE